MDNISADKEYRYQSGGTATILTTDRKCQGRWTVVSMSDHGALRFHDSFGAEKNNSCDDLVEVSKWDCFHKGQIVEVRRGNSNWRLRRFHSVFSRGNPMTFNELDNSSTPVVWDDCRVPRDWELVRAVIIEDEECRNT